MAEFKNIYVDLTQDNISEILDTNDIVICNDETEQGTITNPIGFDEFRKYLRLDHGDQTFYLKGKRKFEFPNSIGVGNLGVNIILETPHNNRTIIITNWKTSIGTQEPWNLWADGVEKVYIACNGDNLQIINGEIEAYSSQIIFGYPVNSNTQDEDYKGNLVIVNSKLQTDTIRNGNTHSFSFLNFETIAIDYSILNVRCNDPNYGSFLVDNDTDFKTNITISNTFLIRIKEFLSYKKFDDIRHSFDAQYCVFYDTIENINAEIDSNYNYFKVSNANNEFDWSYLLPYELGVDLYGLSQLSAFNYYDSTWHSNVKGNKTNFSGKQYCYNDRRDGIGALTFPTLENFRVDLNPPNTCNSGTIVTVSAGSLSAYNYFDNNRISGLQIFVKNNGSDVEVTSNVHDEYVEFVSNETGDLSVGLILSSFNGWYNKQTIASYNVTNQSYYTGTADLDFDMNVYVLKTKCISSEYVLATNTNVSAFDTIMLSAWNSTNSNDVVLPENVIKAVRVDFENNLDENVCGWITEDNSTSIPLSKIGSSDRFYHVCKSPGIRYVTLQAQFYDNTIISKTTKIIVTAEPIKTYYVDISENYENNVWWDSETIFSDDFESGLSACWNTPVKTSASVKTFNGDKVLSTNYNFLNPLKPFNKQLLALPAFINTNFSVEFSMVRIERDSIQKFAIVDNSDNIQFVISWDYLKDCINFKFYNYSEHSIQYDLKSMGLTKDLRCSNSLRKLYFKIIQDEFSADKWFKFYYKFNITDDWILYTGFNYEYIKNP